MKHKLNKVVMERELKMTRENTFPALASDPGVVDQSQAFSDKDNILRGPACTLRTLKIFHLLQIKNSRTIRPKTWHS